MPGFLNKSVNAIPVYLVDDDGSSMPNGSKSDYGDLLAQMLTELKMLNARLASGIRTQTVVSVPLTVSV